MAAVANAAAPQPGPEPSNDLLRNLNDFALTSDGAGGKKKADTLFGPSIGIVSAGPAWTDRAAKPRTQPADELTAEIVKGWIQKSKEGTQPTTTLQALVNLKRPTLRLTPLKAEEDEEGHAHAQHALEFEYDCDAAKCAIAVHVVLDAGHPEAPADGAPAALVFEATVDGGFGRRLTLAEGATLELGRFDAAPPANPPEDAAPAQPAAAAAAAAPSEPVRPPANGGGNTRSRRFSKFHLRKRQPAAAVAAGPALAVVDAEAPAPAANGAPKEGADAKKEPEDGEGVRVAIRLTALNEDGRELPNANEQATYLHVVRVGAAPAAPEDEDTRPWIVKVVKREAVIGLHTFHLHEIYGLSSASASTAAPPTAPAPDGTNTYPPAPAVGGALAADDDAGAASECLLCLSAPREVVLLPCRHLVACKDCALNMIEFGAGGTINQATDDAPDGADPAAGENAGPDGAADGTNGAAATAAAAAAPTPAPRRKRRAKGWFCPVCRQPYTSLLRITTSPLEEKKDEPAAAAEPPKDEPASSGGPLAGITRPGFLRGLSALGSRSQAAASAPADVERGGA